MKKTNFILIILLFLFSCGNKSRRDSMHLDSDDFAGKNKRIEKLSQVINFKSGVKDAEFELFNVNGFDARSISIPGASSWDYKYCIKVDPDDVHKWTEGMDSTGMPKNLKWIKEITQGRSVNWVTNSVPLFYEVPGDATDYMIVYDVEGILFVRRLNP